MQPGPASPRGVPGLSLPAEEVGPTCFPIRLDCPSQTIPHLGACPKIRHQNRFWSGDRDGFGQRAESVDSREQKHAQPATLDCMECPHRRKCAEKRPLRRSTALRNTPYGGDEPGSWVVCSQGRRVSIEVSNPGISSPCHRPGSIACDRPASRQTTDDAQLGGQETWGGMPRVNMD